ncbi:MAG TPA: helix-turn-helix transcriptional regulator [Patescibacteria group bacterium]|nr:helix-turn-helix transcriptional regulator [Patescibacteria group bacterium]
MAATPTRKQFGKRLRELRKKVELSQEELGFRAGIHRTYVGAIERGEQNISIDNIHKLAKALKISPDELFKK